MEKWMMIVRTVMIFTVLGFIYLSYGISKYVRYSKSLKDKEKTSFVIGLVIQSLVLAVLCKSMNAWNMMICFIHALFIWIATDIIGKIIRIVFKKKNAFYFEGIIAVITTALWLCVGWYNAHNVKVTEYIVKTFKNITTENAENNDKLKIVAFADSHIGACFHHEKFAEYMEEINKLQPDIVAVVGDFVDDDTSKEDMIKSCQALGKLKTKYGVYLVWGNHDRGYYPEEHRGYGLKDIIDNLKANNVVVLEDEVAKIKDNVYVVGRRDSSLYGNRTALKAIIKDLKPEDYCIVLDHIPNAYKEEAEANADLVLSGHTHGGQFSPILKAGEWLGMNDKTYGHEKRDNTDFIVTSGIANWSLKFKTGCIAEYLLIHIQ